MAWSPDLQSGNQMVSFTIISTISPLAQLEEHLSYIQDVVGSIPTGTTQGRLVKLVITLDL